MKIKLLLIASFLTCAFAWSCGPTGDSSKMAQDEGPLPPTAGKSIYSTHCVVCHGTDGKLGLNEAGDLTESTLGLEERIAIISQGKGTMIAYNRILSPREIEAVAQYTRELKSKAGDAE